MPLYEYECLECHKTFEVLQKMNDEPLGTCLYCNGQVNKLISASSFQLKGSGWYVTDYKNKTHKDSGSQCSCNSCSDNISSPTGKEDNATIK